MSGGEQTDEHRNNLDLLFGGEMSDMLSELVISDMSSAGFHSGSELAAVGVDSQAEYHLLETGAELAGISMGEIAGMVEGDNKADLRDSLIISAVDYYSTIGVSDDNDFLNEVDVPENILDSSFRIGASFNGVAQIMEKENDIAYCPSGQYCIFKCVEKFLLLKYGITLNINKSTAKTTPTLDDFRKKMTTYLSKLSITENGVIRNMKLEDLPKIYSTRHTEKKKLKLTQTKSGIINDKLTIKSIHSNKIGKQEKLTEYEFYVLEKNTIKTEHNYAILLLPIKVSTDTSNTYHAILAKNVPTINKGGETIISTNGLSELFPTYYNMMELQTLKTISSETINISIKVPIYDTPEVFAYDYETSGSDKGFQKVEGVSVIHFDINDSESIKFDNVVAFIGENSTDDLISFVVKKCIEKGNNRAQLFAHNGGGFDTIITKGYATRIKWKAQYGTGSNIKMLVGEAVDENTGKKILIKFKDSLAFLPMSLKSACDKLKIKDKYGYSKLDLDIANKGSDWFLTYADVWIKYMKIDSLVLAFILFSMQKTAKTLSQSLLTSTGTPSMAFNSCLNNSAPEISRVRVHKGIVNTKFIKEAQYGGRVLHWRKYFKADETLFEYKDGFRTSRGLICLDANSLYPFAMANYDYPYGDPHVFNIERSFEDFKAYMDNLDFSKSETENISVMNKKVSNPVNSPPRRLSLLEKARAKITENKSYLYIAEVEFDAGNVRYPLIPVRLPDGSLRYKAGKFTGVYTSVDINEAISMGYKVLRVIRGFIYPKKCAMFSDWIRPLFEKRKENKGTELDLFIKLLMNAAYGKFSELSDHFITFSDDVKILFRMVSQYKCKTGQIQRKYKYNNPTPRNPSQIGAFVLSYSKAHMNELIRGIGPENILYGDTDSIYTTVESWNEYKASVPDPEKIDGNALGAFKNDYEAADPSKELLISEAHFIDLKRYLVIFNAPDKAGNIYKVKFVGLKFVDRPSMERTAKSYINPDGSQLFSSQEVNELSDLFNRYNGLQLELSPEQFIESNKIPDRFQPVFLNHCTNVVNATIGDYARRNGLLKYREVDIIRSLFEEFQLLANGQPETPEDDNTKITKKNRKLPEESLSIKMCQTKFKRIFDNVIVSNDESAFSVNPNKRARWINGIFYPLNFNHSQPPRLIGNTIVKYPFTESKGYLDNFKEGRIEFNNPLSSDASYTADNGDKFATNIINARGLMYKVIEIYNKNTKTREQRFIELGTGGIRASPKITDPIKNDEILNTFISFKAGLSIFGKSVPKEEVVKISKKLKLARKNVLAKRKKFEENRIALEQAITEAAMLQSIIDNNLDTDMDDEIHINDGLGNGLNFDEQEYDYGTDGEEYIINDY